MASISEQKVAQLEKRAATIRRHLIRTFHRGGGGHYGGGLSIIEILTILYFHTMRYDPGNPKDPDRDRFILSKGHASVALDCTLAEAGFFPVQWLERYMTPDSPITTHPDMHRTPGVEMSSGSLGHGICVALGMALAAKMDRASYRVFTVIGDGETDEGTVWEAAMAAAHHKLDNLIAVTDRNKLSMDGPTAQVMDLEPLADKWRAFGWGVREVDGHSVRELAEALDEVPFRPGRPSMIIAHTVKARGLPWAEGRTEWHAGRLTAEQYAELTRQWEGQ